jgi:hypothetical protein
MKSLLKFTLLSALIISGKLAKQSPTIAVAQNVETTTAPDTTVVFVHQVTSTEPAKAAQETVQPQQNGPSLLANLF